MRFAIYFTPPADDPLTTLAAEWLGRDAFDNRATRGRDPEIDPLVSEPARYGFHATLKAPFRLRDGMRVEDLETRFADFVLPNRSFDLGFLALTQLGRFFALTPATPPAALYELEEAVRTAFEPFRAPLSEAEIARRQPHKLPPQQRENLELWGYPHVGKDFRFHMTLTGSLDDTVDTEALKQRLFNHLDPALDRPVPLDAITLFVEPEPGAPFHVHTRSPFGGALHSTNRP